MSNGPAIDVAAAHRFFSADCFNRAWDLIDEPNRTPEEDQQMVLRSLGSLWHWTEREDCTDQNLSIGYWQVSRVHALIGDGASARRYGEQCLRYSAELPPFFVAYAHEALARAAKLEGDARQLMNHLTEARRLAELVSAPDERAALEADLATLQARRASE